MKIKSLLLLAFLISDVSFSQVTTVVLGAQVRQQRNIINGGVSNISLPILSANGQEFVNFAKTNPVTGSPGCPDQVEWHSHFGLRSDGKIGLTQDFWDYMDGVDGFMPRAEAETAISDMQADIDSKSTFTGSWNDLSDKPTIPAAQVQSDWSAVSGLGVILNKPTIPTNTNQLTNGAGFITGVTSGQITTALGFTPYSAANPNGYTANDTDANLRNRSNHTGTQSWSTITGTPTSLSGYGISDGVTSASLTTTLSGYATTGALSAKFNTPSGTTSEYVRGNGTLATFPTIPTNTNQLTNGSNFVDVAGARGSVSLTTTGSGAATYNSTTGVLNVPTPSAYTLPNTGTAGTYSGVTTDAQGRVTAGTTRSFTNNPSRTIQTVAAAGNGWQIDASRDSTVSYSVTIATSLTLSGGTSGYVVLEIASTNSSTAANWQEIDRLPNGQSGTGLVVGLGINNTGGGSVAGWVPAGYYVRMRSVNTSGTPVYTYTSGQEVKQ